MSAFFHSRDSRASGAPDASNRKREKMPAEKPSSRPGHHLPSLHRAGAKGILKGIFRGLIALVITGGVVFAGIAAHRHATTSKHFACRQLSITGEKRLAEAEILETAGIVLGQNIFGIDLEESRRALVAHPWIASAEVERKLPGAIHIRLVERRAKAMINFDVLYLVDDTGKVFKRWKRGDPIPSPVITGIARDHFVENSAEAEDIIRDAIDLADRFRASGLEKIAPLAEIHREEDDGFSFTLGDDPTYVRFGKGPYRQKLSRLSTLLSRLDRDGEKPSVIYFDNEIRPDRITVKLKRNEETAAESPENIVTTEIKKRVSKI